MIYRNNNILNSYGQLIEMMFVCERNEGKKERERCRVIKLKDMVFLFLCQVVFEIVYNVIVM